MRNMAAAILITSSALISSGCKEKNIGDTLDRANAGDASAQFEMGVKYHDLDRSMTVTAEDEKNAFQWYKKAADQGHTMAEFYTGICYLYRLGTPGDDRLAIGYLMKAADKNCSLAQVKVAECYTSGYGVVKDAAIAFKWLNKAAEQADRGAIYKIGCMYDRAEGVEKSDVKAVEWFQKGVALGSAECLYDLGLHLESGRGIPKDEIEAYACYNVAAITLEQARHNLEDIERKLPVEARIRGQQRSKEIQKYFDAKVAERKAAK